MKIKPPYLYLLCIATLVMTSCKRSTPVEMLFGKWEIESIEENGHFVTDEYVSTTTKYLILNESGHYHTGLIGTSEPQSWIAEPAKNQLILLDAGLMDGIKKWDVLAADNQLKLKFPERDIIITLNRIQKLPEIDFKTTADLIGKWTVDKVTINGTNSTSNYAYPDRWIILAKGGRFYNGHEEGNLISGFWQTDEYLTTIDFRLKKSNEGPAFTFHIDRENIWYEKEKDAGDKNSVKIFFKKEEG